MTDRMWSWLFGLAFVALMLILSLPDGDSNIEDRPDDWREVCTPGPFGLECG